MDFIYKKPLSLDTALLLLQHPGSYIYAGGTDILVKIREKKIKPVILVDIKGLEDLNGIWIENNHIKIGALTTIEQILESDILKKTYPMFYQAAIKFACLEIRNRATIGGNICNGAPCAQMATPLLCLDAKLELISSAGSRFVDINDFFIKPGVVNIEQGEILAYIHIPLIKEKFLCFSYKVSRSKGMDLPSANFSILVINPEKPENRIIKLAVGSVYKVPFRLKKVEEFLSYKELKLEHLIEMQNLIKNSISPRSSSVRASPDFKKEILAYTVSKFLQENLNIKT